MPEKLPNHLLHGRILPWRQTYSSYAEALREGPRKLRENKENVGMGNFQSFGKKVDAGWSSFYGTLEPGNLPESKISIEAYSGTGKKNESNDKVEIDGWGTSKVYKIAPGHNTTKPGSFGMGISHESPNCNKSGWGWRIDRSMHTSLGKSSNRNAQTVTARFSLRLQMSKTLNIFLVVR